MANLIWQKGQTLPADLPTGEYEFVYRIPKLYLGSQMSAAADQMLNQLIDLPNGELFELTSWTSNDPLFSLYVDFTFKATVYGADPLAIIIALTALAVAVGLIEIFTEGNLKQINQLVKSPAGALAVGAGSLVIIAAAGFAVYEFVKSKRT